MKFAREDLEAAAARVHAVLPPTPQYAWPLLAADLGTEVWLKHENHTPIGAFKVRGGVTFVDALVAAGRPQRLITATRGNHGQSIPFAARRHGLPVTIVVPHGNSVEKNAAMRALGVDLVEHGDDFQAAYEHAQRLAQEHGWVGVPPFHRDLVRGVASASMELFGAVHDIDVAYVPIGMGSGACGMLAARAALGLRTRIVGVVSAHAPAIALSFERGTCVEAPAHTALADGLAVRAPNAEAVAALRAGLDDVVRVSDREVARAMRTVFEATHNVAEGAGAAAYAAAWKDRGRLAGKRVAVMLTGGNVDRALFARVLGAPVEAWADA